MWQNSFSICYKYTNPLFYFQTFQKYLSYKKDHSELLYYILRQLTMDQLAYMRGLHNHSQPTIEISERDLLERARQINISDLKPFYDSRIFKMNSFSYDAKRKVIVHVLPDTPTSATAWFFEKYQVFWMAVQFIVFNFRISGYIATYDIT